MVCFVRTDDFYVEQVSQWGFTDITNLVLNTEMLDAISRGHLPDRSDLEVAVALARLAHDEYELCGTSGSALGREDSALILRALSRVLKRLGVEGFELPFRDFDTFRTYWNRNGAYGSWQARRDILNGFFSPLHEELERRDEATMEWTLVTAISPHPITGWSRVDQEISELRRHFNGASSQQDYSNIGNDCVAVLEALSAAAYTHEKHGVPGQEEPPVANTKTRFDRYIEVELPDSGDKYVRKLARASIELAQAVKHRRETATRKEAGIAADSVILLANILRRLQS